MLTSRKALLTGTPRPGSALTYGGSGVSGTDLSSYSFASVSIAHAPDAQRIVYCYVYNSLTGATTANSLPSAVTIGGMTAWLVPGAQRAVSITNTTTISLYAACVPDGATATVVVTFPASQRRCGVAIASTIAFKLFPPFSGVLGAVNADPITGDLLVPKTGLIGAIAADAATGQPLTFAGAGAVEVDDQVVEGGTRQGLATINQTGAISITSTNDSGSSAVWMAW